MPIKKLEIIGFKSFPDKAILSFPEKGITGIVGPNGCGKSNISDALRWVLGEQSIKLRGEGRLDVIFAGNQKRKPLNVAEVTVIFDNKESVFPIAYEEVAITRKLYRNGESEYYINKHLVRLKDVTDLLMNSGLGKNAITSVEQGKMDQVILLSPLERRAIFEEAAGISRFLIKKKESAKKLELVDQNLLRAQDLFNEIEKQVKVLEIQAKEAQKYKENKARIEVYEKELFCAKWQENKKNQQVMIEKEKVLKQEVEDLIKKMNESEIFIHKYKEEADQVRNLLQENKESFLRLSHEKILNEKENQLLDERLVEKKKKESCLQREIHSLVLQEKKWQEEEKIILQNVRQGKEKQNHEEKQSKIIHEQIQLLEKEFQVLKKEEQKLEQEKIKFIQEQAALESEIKQIKIRLENSVERQNILHARSQESHKDYESLKLEIERKRIALEEASKIIDKFNEEVKQLNMQLKSIDTELQEIERSRNEQNQLSTEYKTRHKLLKKLHEEMEGYSSGAKLLLKESSNPKSVLYNKLKPLLSYFIPNEMEMAANAILKIYEQTLVIEKAEDFLIVKEFALNNKLEDFSLFCIENKKNISKEYTKNSVLKYMEQNPIASHFLENICIETTIPERPEKGIKYVTKEGFLLDENGVLFIPGKGENQIFIRQSEIKKLEKQIVHFESLLNSYETNYKNVKKKRETLQQEKSDGEKNVRKEEMKLIEINYSLQRAKTDLQKNEEAKKQLEEELLKIANQITLLHNQESLLCKKQEDRGNIQENHLISLQKIKDRLHEKIEELRSIQFLHNDKTKKINLLKEELKKYDHQLALLDLKKQESLKQKKQFETELEECSLFEEKGKLLKNEILLKEEKIRKNEELERKKESELLEKNKEKNEQLAKFSTHYKNQEKILKEKEQLLVPLQINSTQLQAQRENLETEINEKYPRFIHEILAFSSSLNKTIDQLEKGIKTLHKELEQAGNINLCSIEEFKTCKERYEFMKKQLEDLVIAKSELISVIHSLDQESRILLRKTYAQIRLNFEKNFKILFNGGEASLELVEKNDILEAGIEIIAKPPGKQMKTLSLLSGGEKCLTALALLFAIFEVKPAPFCILDEIDAPLDEMNVERFVKLLKQFLDKTQFIIITHNKLTMAQADLLFGIFADEGISKILKMEFEKQSLIMA